MNLKVLKKYIPDSTILFDDLMRLIDVLIIVFAIFGCVYLPSEQFFEWLKTGITPARDLFWVMGESDTLISPAYMHVTDWVGANQIINYFLDLHLGVIAIAFAYMWMKIRLTGTNN